jgi:hypothetical protein
MHTSANIFYRCDEFGGFDCIEEALDVVCNLDKQLLEYRVVSDSFIHGDGNE